MTKTIYIILGLLILASISFLSCEEFLEVDAPENKIVSEAVFNSDETAASAMSGIYNELFRAAFSGGWENSVTVLSGLSSDNLKTIRENDLNLREYSENNIQPNNSRNLALWSSAYSIIYMTNSILEGLEASDNLSEGIKTSLEGEAKFVRAFTYFYLVNLYGEIPLILSTDYRENSLATRNSEEDIYQQIITDLNTSRDLLDDNYRHGDRTGVNRSCALALLARVHLYKENWEEADLASSEVISNTQQYEIISDPNQVFLANSKEAIWQITPEGRGGPLGFTNEGSIFLFLSIAPGITKVALTEELVNSFVERDQRLHDWIGFNEDTQNYFVNKYKDRRSINEILEFSMVLRLAEQYLIRSEARVMKNNFAGALADLDVLRVRAGLPILSANNEELSKEELLDTILEERRKELFTEWGHRWLDLKRTNKADYFLPPSSEDWENTDIYYPIPAQELMKNPNLTQNPGY
ncbi:RagB/SusD family nutrient uptake outer membrane protein [Salegentibacter maritimus]|uniref:RagB/SusD family nutrient uptake outer membrane protein n=1 Tax=Salegentibacter maritimus TaxID=2794347 RepID=UPI0018E49D73|nr:RagB/SusD family nutrient uptake outer membrane protein [Salegentibacter maritimus]MBI6116837.1 RagB/SusD family nutrient uptake outer membrane protein [Salegentibacter maritimus]